MESVNKTHDNRFLSIASDETRSTKKVEAVCDKFLAMCYFVGESFHPSPLLHPASVGDLHKTHEYPVKFEEVKTYIDGVVDTNMLASTLMVTVLNFCSDYARPSTIIEVYPHANFGYTQQHQLEAWMLTLYRATHYPDGTARPQSERPKIVAVGVDSCGPQRLAMVYLMTPNAEEIEAGVEYLGLLDEDFVYYGKYFWENPIYALGDWDHWARTARRNLANARLAIAFGVTDGGIDAALWSVLEEMKDILGPRGGFLSDALDYNWYG